MSDVVTRGVLGRLAVLVGVATLVAIAAAPAPSGALAVVRTTPCRLGVTYRFTSPTATRTVVVKVRRANIRRGPGTDCARLTSLAKGATLRLTGPRATVGHSTWLQVAGRFGIGWIAATLVR